MRRILLLATLTGSLVPSVSRAQVAPPSFPRSTPPTGGMPRPLPFPSSRDMAPFTSRGPSPFQASEPRPLPASLPPTAPVVPLNTQDPSPNRADVTLPYPEQPVPIDTGAIMLKRLSESWQLWAGRIMLRNFGNAEADAREALRVVRDLKVDEWVAIGGPKPVVEYGLHNGRATVAMGVARFALPIDMKTVRAENLRGVWVVRDNDTLHFNFGPNRADAEQAVAVIHKYGFDRVGFVGQPTPVMAYLFVAPPGEEPLKLGLGEFGKQAQIEAMTRTGIPVPGLGFVGEMVKIDPRRTEVRRDGYDWVLAHGPDVLTRFGPGEWQARDALKVVQDGRFTEWCHFGKPGVSFFLVGGKAPTRVPFAVVGRQFGVTNLQVKQLNAKWHVTEAGRPLFEVANAAEGEDLIRLLHHFGFNQVCQTGNSARASLSFLAKSR